MQQPRDLENATDDERLVLDFQEGSEPAFDALYRLHQARVRSVARRHLRDPRDVEEAVQDTFVKAFRALPRFSGNFRTGAWLARIAVNSSIDIARKNQRRGESVPLGHHDMQSVDAVDDLVVGSGPDVDAALEHLPVGQARALRLRALEGASHAEIAEALGGTPNQAKALLHRARESFRRVWREVGSGAAFFLVAGVTALGMRLSRTLGPAASTMGSSSSGAIEAFSGATVGVLDQAPQLFSPFT